MPSGLDHLITVHFDWLTSNYNSMGDYIWQVAHSTQCQALVDWITVSAELIRALQEKIKGLEFKLSKQGETIQELNTKWQKEHSKVKQLERDLAAAKLASTQLQ